MNTIEPPILMSRIMTFVFAAALATVVVLVLTLSNLSPLSRTQIFFLTTVPKNTLELEIKPYAINDSNIEEFKKNFIKEYVKVRNEVIPNLTLMRNKWRSGSGIVSILSDEDVFAAFLRTNMVNKIMSDLTDLGLRCSVEFTNDIKPYTRDSESSSYIVNFRYFCADNAGQTAAKDYTIIVSVMAARKVKWENRLENPLGMTVIGYRVESGGNDPLNLLFAHPRKI